jgi:hypothetical protein
MSGCADSMLAVRMAWGVRPGVVEDGGIKNGANREVRAVSVLRINLLFRSERADRTPGCAACWIDWFRGQTLSDW